MDNTARQTRAHLTALNDLPTNQCRTFIEQRLAQHVGAQLNISAATVDIACPLATLGFDAAAALRLRHHLAEEFALPIPAAVALPQMSIRALGSLIAHGLGFDGMARTTGPEPLALVPTSTDTISGWLARPPQDRALSPDEVHSQEPVRPERVETFMVDVSQRHDNGLSILT